MVLRRRNLLLIPELIAHGLQTGTVALRVIIPVTALITLCNSTTAADHLMRHFSSYLFLFVVEFRPVALVPEVPDLSVPAFFAGGCTDALFACRGSPAF